MRDARKGVKLGLSKMFCFSYQWVGAKALTLSTCIKEGFMSGFSALRSEKRVTVNKRWGVYFRLLTEES